MNFGRYSALTTLLYCICTSPRAEPLAQSAEFQVTGTLLESACYLDLSSAYQNLSIGEVSTAQLSRVGDQGKAVPLHLKLRGCVRTSGARNDERLGSLAWSTVEPLASLTFRAASDNHTPGLIKVIGAEGFGLRLFDVQGHSVRLGHSAPPWFISPGGNQLTYYIRPERTATPLKPGVFRASLNVSLVYD